MIELNDYHPTGKVGARAWLVYSLAGIPLAVALGYGLAWAQALASGFIASTICVFLAAVVIGVAFAVLAEQAHSRSTRLNTGMAVVLLLCLLAMRWWRSEVTDDAGLSYLITHASISEWAAPAVGAIFEALVVGFIAIFMMRNQPLTPYSESTHKWAIKGFSGELWADSASASQVQDGLQANGAECLLNMVAAAQFGAAPVASMWRTVEVQGYWVEADAAARWLTVKVKTHQRDSDGKIKTQEEDVLKHGLVSAADYVAIQAILDGAATPQEESTAPASTSEEPPTPTVLQPAVTALEAEQYSVCVSLAQAHCQHPDRQTQVDAWRLCGLAFSRMNKWDQAFDHFHHLFELEPTTLNALQLATTSVMSGELTRGEAWFVKAIELNEQEAAMPPARLRTAYLSALENAGEFEATLPHLEWLARGYAAMQITDDHFVWSRGFPFLAEFLSKSQSLLSNVLPGKELRTWYEQMNGELDSQGQEKLQSHLAGLH